MQADLEAKGLRLVATHTQKVRGWMALAIVNLLERANVHDDSKYSQEEIGLILGKSAFDQLPYMSQEERIALGTVKSALDHHYSFNSHHPEHHEKGVKDMSLFDLIEMVCDWKAAGEMSPDGNFTNSLEYGRERFGLSLELASILERTALELGWLSE